MYVKQQVVFSTQKVELNLQKVAYEQSVREVEAAKTAEAQTKGEEQPAAEGDATGKPSIHDSEEGRQAYASAGGSFLQWRTSLGKASGA